MAAQSASVWNRATYAVKYVGALTLVLIGGTLAVWPIVGDDWMRVGLVGGINRWVIGHELGIVAAALLGLGMGAWYARAEVSD